MLVHDTVECVEVVARDLDLQRACEREQGRPAELELHAGEDAILAVERFHTLKPVLYLANTAEDDPHGEGPLPQALRDARGADRVVLNWPADAPMNSWLQVTMRSDMPNTGLLTDDALAELLSVDLR